MNQEKNSGSRLTEDSSERILVVKLYAIGDYIMSLPFLELLRKHHPSAEIHLLTGNIIAPLAECSAPVDRVIPVDERILTTHRRHLSLLSLAFRLRKRRYTSAYLLHRVLPLRLFLLITGVQNRIGQGVRKLGLTKTVPFETGLVEHDSERYARLLGWDGSETLPAPRINLPENTISGPITSLIKTSPVAVSPGGGRSSIRNTNSKRWPSDRFGKLINLLHGEGIRTVVLGSKEDGKVIGNLLDCLPDTSTNLIGKTSLVEAAAVLAGCRMHITNDSSLMHIAGLVSTPTLTLFGPTDPERIGIYPKKQLHRNLISYSIGCPCHPEREIDDCETAECIKSLSLEKVWNETREMLRQT